MTSGAGDRADTAVVVPGGKTADRDPCANVDSGFAMDAFIKSRKIGRGDAREHVHVLRVLRVCVRDARAATEPDREQQVQQVYDLFTACNMNDAASRRKFYEVAGVDSVEKIRADQYQGLVQMLMKKERQVRGTK